VNFYLLILVSLCYAGTGLDFMLRGQIAWGIFWTSYAVANCAFLVATGAKP